MWPGLCISDGKMQGGKRILLTEQEFSAISPLPLKKKMVDNYSPVEKILGFIVVVVGTIYEKHIL